MLHHKANVEASLNKKYMFKTKLGQCSSNHHTYSQLNKQGLGKTGNTLRRTQKLCCEVLPMEQSQTMVVIHQRQTFQQAWICEKETMSHSECTPHSTERANESISTWHALGKSKNKMRKYKARASIISDEDCQDKPDARQIFSKQTQRGKNHSWMFQ